MEVVLHYSFNDYYREGPEIFKIVDDDFKYCVNLTEEDLQLSDDDLHEKYRNKAFLKCVSDCF